MKRLLILLVFLFVDYPPTGAYAEPMIDAFSPRWCAACPRWKSKLGESVKWKNEEHAKGRGVLYPCFTVNGKPLLTKSEEYEALMQLSADDVMAVLKARALKAGD